MYIIQVTRILRIVVSLEGKALCKIYIRLRPIRPITVMCKIFSSYVTNTTPIYNLSKMLFVDTCLSLLPSQKNSTE